MAKKKCFLSESDPFCFTLYSQDETVEMFGQDFIDEEYGDKWHELPEEVYEEFREVSKRFWELNQKIREIKKDQE